MRTGAGMTARGDSALRRVNPPVYMLVALMGVGALRWIDFGLPDFPGWVSVPGMILAGAGLAAVTSGDAAFKRAGTAVSPGQPTSVLVTEGLYRYSRNPMYVGMVAVVAGAALALGEPVALLPAIALAVLLDRVFVRAEEPVLRERFGEDYEEYLARVRRWL